MAHIANIPALVVLQIVRALSVEVSLLRMVSLTDILSIEC